MATSYLLPCYVLITVLVLFFSVDVTEGAIREYQFDVSMHIYIYIYMSACVYVQQSSILPPSMTRSLVVVLVTCSCNLSNASNN
jgi:hypothetical protein